MTEFAYSALGLNPHYGTPGNPADRARAPGGSSSGAAVAVADAMCEIAIGSDTGGSTRIPAAFCGVVGFKPSHQRVPTAGAFPLSFSFDSIGPLARTVADCAAADAVMAGDEPWALDPAPIAGLRVGLPQGFPLEGLDADVTAGFSRATMALTKAGARLSDEKLPLLDEMMRINATGGIVLAEAYAVHRDQLAARTQDFDPNVGARIAKGRDMSAADYVIACRERAALVKAMARRLADVDVLALPTTPVVAPKMADVATRETFRTVNLTVLRNTAIVNFFDLCAISLPVPVGSGLPVGLMLVARNGDDRRLFRIAAAVERQLN